MQYWLKQRRACSGTCLPPRVLPSSFLYSACCCRVSELKPELAVRDRRKALHGGQPCHPIWHFLHAGDVREGAQSSGLDRSRNALSYKPNTSLQCVLSARPHVLASSGTSQVKDRVGASHILRRSWIALAWNAWLCPRLSCTKAGGISSASPCQERSKIRPSRMVSECSASYGSVRLQRALRCK